MSSTQAYRRTPKGVLTNMYGQMKRRNYVAFSLQEFHLRFLDDKKFNRLFVEWAKSGFKKSKKPSLDRISRKKSYTVENTHMITWAENRIKQNVERKRRGGPIEQIKDGEIIAVHKSQREAVLDTGIRQGNISSVLNGKRKYAGGFEWRYKSTNRSSDQS